MERSMREGKLLEGSGRCALCEGEARMHCESDDAMLCWDCDARVHGANFLVARHTRALLCRSCKAPTPWKASGPRLTPSASLCSQCCFGSDGDANHGLIKGETLETEDEEENIAEVKKGKEEAKDEEGDNQVVPWGIPVAVTITPSVASSSSRDGLTLKRRRDDLVEQSSSLEKDEEAEPTSMPVRLFEFDIIKKATREENGVSETRRHVRLRKERKRSLALTHASVSVGTGNRLKAACSPTTVAGEPSMSRSTARQSITRPEKKRNHNPLLFEMHVFAGDQIIDGGRLSLPQFGCIHSNKLNYLQVAAISVIVKFTKKKGKKKKENYIQERI